jgi:hypothetical protein
LICLTPSADSATILVTSLVVAACSSMDAAIYSVAIIVENTFVLIDNAQKLLEEL